MSKYKEITINEVETKKRICLSIITTETIDNLIEQLTDELNKNYIRLIYGECEKI